MLIRRLERALAEQSQRLVVRADDEWRRTARLYTPILEDLLSRAQRAPTPEDLQFLAQQAERLLALCALNSGQPADERSSSARETQVLALPLARLRRRMAYLARCLANSDCQNELRYVLGVPVAPHRVSVDDLVLRALARVLLLGWGSRDILAAPIPTRGRPRWDLYATDLSLVVGARPNAQAAPLLALAPHRLIVAVVPSAAGEMVEARLLRDPLVDQPVSWTGLRWDEEQRLRAAAHSIGEYRAISPAARQLQRAVARLEAHFVEVLAHQPPRAPWVWRPTRRVVR